MWEAISISIGVVCPLYARPYLISPLDMWTDSMCIYRIWVGMWWISTVSHFVTSIHAKIVEDDCFRYDWFRWSYGILSVLSCRYRHNVDQSTFRTAFCSLFSLSNFDLTMDFPSLSPHVIGTAVAVGTGIIALGHAIVSSVGKGGSTTLLKPVYSTVKGLEAIIKAKRQRGMLISNRNNKALYSLLSDLFNIMRSIRQCSSCFIRLRPVSFSCASAWSSESIIGEWPH